MVTVTVQGTAAEVLREMEQMCNLQSVTIKTVTMEEMGKTMPKSTKKETVPPVAPPVPTTLAPATASAVHLTPTGAITLADIQSDIPKLAAKMGKDKTVELLGRYGAKKGSEIKPEDFEKFHTEAKGLLG